MSTTTNVLSRAGKTKRVLVVGAGGYLGLSVVRAFSQAGYQVRGLVRDPRTAPLVRDAGGAPEVGNVLNVRSVRIAAAGCSGIVHLAANPPVESDLARVRVEGARNLVEAAREERVLRVVIGSGYWVYGGQSEPIREDSVADPHGESRINFDAEQVGLEANSPDQMEVLVARPGMVYGNGSWFRGMAESIRTGEYRVIGNGTNRWSFVDRWDTGTAFRTILESGAAGEVYNVVDGKPAPLREFADFVATELGVASPGSIDLAAAEAAIGATVARHLAADRPATNAKLLGLGWQPSVPSYREGIPIVLREMFPRSGESPESTARRDEPNR